MKNKKLFIVFEGVDGTGKSTLAKAIADKYGVEVTHNDKSLTYEEGKKNSYDYIEKLKEMPFGVIDRLVHTGEAVYAPIYRGYTGIDYFNDLEEKMLEEFDILMVYVHAENDVIEERLKSRGEDYISLKDIDRLKGNYDYYLRQTEIPFITFDSGKDSLENNINKLSVLIPAAVGRYFANNK